MEDPFFLVEFPVPVLTVPLYDAFWHPRYGPIQLNISGIHGEPCKASKSRSLKARTEVNPIFSPAAYPASASPSRRHETRAGAARDVRLRDPASTQTTLRARPCCQRTIIANVRPQSPGLGLAIPSRKSSGLARALRSCWHSSDRWPRISFPIAHRAAIRPRASLATGEAFACCKS